MTDVKKTNSAKNNYHKSNGTKKPNTNRNYNHEKKYHEDTKKRYDKDNYEDVVKVRKVEFVSDDELESEEDKKLIIIIALSILVIIGTVIGLLVGCQKEMDNDPINQNDDVIVDDDTDKDNYLEEEVAKKTSTKVTKTSSEKKEVKEMFDVKYLYGEDAYHHESVEDGEYAPKYLPAGYNACRYYNDSEFTSEFDFETGIENDTKIYLECSATIYNVNYVYNLQLASNETLDGEEVNPTEFSSEENITLNALNTDYLFLGWYLNYDDETDTYSNQVIALNRNLYKYANDGEITLYGKVLENINVTYSDGEHSEVKNVREESTYTVEENIFELDDFIGWSLEEDSKRLVTNVMNLTGDVTLYAVCGDAVIEYVTETETVIVAYTDEELHDENFVLPTPSDLGMDTPTYVIPVSEETATSKKVVSEYDVEINLEKQISLLEAQEKAVEGYEVKLGDNVEELESEFTGWKESDGTLNPDGELNTEEEPVTKEEVVENLTESVEEIAEEILVGEYEVVVEFSVVEG